MRVLEIISRFHGGFHVRRLAQDFGAVSPRREIEANSQIGAILDDIGGAHLRPVGPPAAARAHPGKAPVRRAGLKALRRVGRGVREVSAVGFEEAFDDSRATVTQKMEQEYEKRRGELKKRAAEVAPIGFIHEGMVSSTRDAKHE